MQLYKQAINFYPSATDIDKLVAKKDGLHFIDGNLSVCIIKYGEPTLNGDIFMPGSFKGINKEVSNEKNSN